MGDWDDVVKRQGGRLGTMLVDTPAGLALAPDFDDPEPYDGPRAEQPWTARRLRIEEMRVLKELLALDKAVPIQNWIERRLEHLILFSQAEPAELPEDASANQSTDWARVVDRPAMMRSYNALPPEARRFWIDEMLGVLMDLMA